MNVRSAASIRLVALALILTTLMGGCGRKKVDNAPIELASPSVAGDCVSTMERRFAAIKRVRLSCTMIYDHAGERDSIRAAIIADRQQGYVALDLLDPLGRSSATFVRSSAGLRVRAKKVSAAPLELTRLLNRLTPEIAARLLLGFPLPKPENPRAINEPVFRTDCRGLEMLTYDDGEWTLDVSYPDWVTDEDMPYPETMTLRISPSMVAGHEVTTLSLETLMFENRKAQTDFKPVVFPEEGFRQVVITK